MVNRRQFCCTLAATACAKPSDAKAPFHVLYSNDTTNTMGANSPYHKTGELWKPEMLEASVDEADGADVHLLQPGRTGDP